VITELSRIQIFNWRSCVEAARRALDRPEPSVPTKLRPRERTAIPITVEISPSDTGDGPGLQWCWTDIRAEARSRPHEVDAAARSGLGRFNQASSGG
jgi:hypothetical protein